jgi:c-di-GMP-binding flagellar brake protein YcgR
MTRDRRQITRWRINWQARIRLEGAEAFTYCTVHDINLKGMKISLSQRLPTDTFLKFNLVLSDEFVFDIIEAWVTWHKIIEDKNLYGLYFTKIRDSDKEKIYQFIRKNFPGQMSKQWFKELATEKGEFLMPEEKFEDRRIFERFAVSLGVRFLDLNSNQEGKAQTLDFSAKGIGIVTKERLTAQTPLELWLDIPDKGEPLYTRGEVIWSKVEENNDYRVGINLEKADLMGLSRVLRVI